VSDLASLVVIGTGEADLPDPNLFEAKARAIVRYADPAAWTTATAVARALSNAKTLVAESLHEIGVVVVSDHGPAEAMGAVATAALDGLPSPLRFPAANPGSMVGVSCIALGFRGPTLNLIMPPADGVQIGIQICAGWLSRGAARLMIVAAHADIGLGSRSARAALLSLPENAPGFGEVMTSSLAQWLMRTGKSNQGNS
jgi:hypothetical protein